MKKLLVLLVILVVSQSVFAKSIGVLEGLMKPTSLAIGDDKVYVCQEATVFIYDLKTLKLLKKFGKQGDGPEEFRTLPGLPLTVMVQNDQIQINSANRVSFFTKDGTFIKFLKNKGGTLNIGHQPVGDNFVSLGFFQEDGITYMALNLFDSDLNKLKSLAKVRFSVQQTGKIKLFSDQIPVATYKDKIYLVLNPDFIINTLDVKGDILKTFEIKDFKRVKFEDKHKQMIFDSMEKNPVQRPFLEMFKQRAEFPEYFPAILSIFVVDDLIYIVTWEMKDDKFKFYLYDTNWKLKEDLYVGFQMESGLTPYPPAFKNGNLYQVVENDNEEWELHVTPIKK